MTAEWLVIGYGNELRSDDGVGPRAARTVAGWQFPNLAGLALHQLTPELIDQLAEVRRVIFVDAGQDHANVVSTRRIEPDGTTLGLGHTGDPRALLALTSALYGRSPQAWLISVPIADLHLGEGLSPTAEQGLAAALQSIRNLIDNEEERQPCTNLA